MQTAFPNDGPLYGGLGPNNDKILPDQYHKGLVCVRRT